MSKMEPTRGERTTGGFLAGSPRGPGRKGEATGWGHRSQLFRACPRGRGARPTVPGAGHLCPEPPYQGRRLAETPGRAWGEQNLGPGRPSPGSFFRSTAHQSCRNTASGVSQPCHTWACATVAGSGCWDVGGVSTATEPVCGKHPE